MLRCERPLTGPASGSGDSISGDGVAGGSTSGAGVVGISASGTGVLAASSTGVGATAAGGTAGVVATSNDGIGVRGHSGGGVGVQGLSRLGTGVLGTSDADFGIGVQGVGLGDSGRGLHGQGDSGVGVFGGGTSGVGVLASSGSGTGVESSSGSGFGVSGTSTSRIGVRGVGSGVGATGVYGASRSGTAVFGMVTGPAGAAGGFIGPVYISGRLTVIGGLDVVGAKNFMIDHPSDPENRYLMHTCVESSEMKNIYDGVAQLDEGGAAWVNLPEWFQALNDDFRYQLTAVGGPAPGLHAEEIAEHRFKIAGGGAGMSVSWQVMGVRKDRWGRNEQSLRGRAREARRGERTLPGPRSPRRRGSAPDPGGAHQGDAESRGELPRRSSHRGPKQGTAEQQRPRPASGTDLEQVDAVTRLVQDRSRKRRELGQRLDEHRRPRAGDEL